MKSVASLFCLSLVAGSLTLARADSFSASLYTIQAPAGTVTSIALQGIAPNTRSTIVGNGYTVTFSVASGQGVVQGTTSGAHAVPVAGTNGSSPQYFTGDYGSSLTTDITASGNYFSTGNGTITITFATPQSSLALLWGSVDSNNSVTLNDLANYTVTGSQVQAASQGFQTNGSQGPGGSSYVILNSSSTFTTATFTTPSPSFEFAGVAGSTGQFTVAPEPGSWVLLGSGLGGVAGLVGMRRRARAGNQSDVFAH